MKNKKSNKKQSVWSRLFTNKKPMLIALVIIISFSTVGAYKLSSSSAAVTNNRFGCPSRKYWDRRPTIGIGQQNGCTKTFQYIVNRIFKQQLLDVDGAFGVNTQKWAMGLQKMGGLNADGYVGPNTWKYVSAKCRSMYASGIC